MKFKHLVEPGTALLISGRWEFFQGKDGQQAGYFRFSNLELLSEIREKRFKEVTLQVQLSQLALDFNADLEQLLATYPGRLALKVELWVPDDQRSVAMHSSRFRVSPDQAFFDGLDRLQVGYVLG